MVLTTPGSRCSIAYLAKIYDEYIADQVTKGGKAEELEAERKQELADYQEILKWYAWSDRRAAAENLRSDPKYIAKLNGAEFQEILNRTILDLMATGILNVK